MAVDFIFRHFEKKDFGEKRRQRLRVGKEKTRDREDEKKEGRLERVEEWLIERDVVGERDRLDGRDKNGPL